jgi:hypothetical protein
VRAIILLILCLSSAGNPTRESVDKIEFYVDHHYNEKTKQVEISSEQMVIWEWSPEYRRYNVVTYFFIDEDDLTINKFGGKYYITCIDGEKLYSFETSIVRFTEYRKDGSDAFENSYIYETNNRRLLKGKSFYNE